MNYLPFDHGPRGFSQVGFNGGLDGNRGPRLAFPSPLWAEFNGNVPVLIDFLGRVVESKVAGLLSASSPGGRSAAPQGIHSDSEGPCFRLGWCRPSLGAAPSWLRGRSSAAFLLFAASWFSGGEFRGLRLPLSFGSTCW
ncbi:hypothetical protein L3X38_029165 [Prunus dulcis]|uniref:Uncharacterized protein n=1 Tax=Prunus dulcis TaxID=3755 RepID=A0AAD4Z2R1_PRUDU|nr:hypothetical protein L3X38_029165 [Prunus dulcis]